MLDQVTGFIAARVCGRFESSVNQGRERALTAIVVSPGQTHVQALIDRSAPHRSQCPIPHEDEREAQDESGQG
jgi:hypothetical protein